ncbi:hypothetical protein [Haladaptatus sp. DJG-WS-42]|uniref:hypothetical protein n=1 Tax=Haladaptatus sp. DJG-WS-42 TaxID=3120516 RepID=UPI0030CFBB9B
MDKTVLAVVLVLLAGCGASPVDTATQTTPTPTEMATTETPSVTPSTTVESTTSPATTTAQPTAQPTTEAPPINPWNKNPVTVAIEKPEQDSRNYTPLVEAALDYWETNSTQYTAAEVEFEIVENSSEVDVILRMSPTIQRCGSLTSEDLLGCAPRYSPENELPSPTVVYIATGFVNETTVKTIKHELGHTLGLGHETPPAFMTAYTNATSLSIPNATERRIPFNQATLTVFVNYSNVDDGIDYAYETKIEQALDYYNNGAEGTEPDQLELVVVDTREEADIVINVGDERTEPYTDISVFGYDTDDDPAFEYYSNATITVAGYDSGDTGWIVGYYLGYALGAESNEELPRPFRDGEIDDPNWWEY